MKKQIPGCPTHFSLSWSYGRSLQRIGLLLTSLVLALSCALMVHAQTTTFTYQGRLTDGSTAASGTYQMQFALFDAASVGTQIGATQTNATISVANGLFTVLLDFGAAAFPGANRYLEISVKRPADAAYTTLTPRQPLTSTPYSIQSLNATTATNAHHLNGQPASQYVLTGDTRLADERAPAAGSANYIQNATSPQAASNFNIAGNGTAGGTLSGNVVNATTEYKIGGFRILSAAGTSNTFTGFGAGGAYISGTDNSYFGRSAAGGSETGNHNSFFGANAGILNTTNDNSFFGSRAGFSTTTGARNSFFGRSAGFANAEGADNSFFGRLAGANNTTGVGNTFLGTLTGAANLSGSNNTLIGTGANTTANNLTNATAIGAGATATASNTVTLGRSADAVQVPGTLTVTGTLNANGANLTSLNASNITTGTLDDARLSANVARRDAAQTFVGNQTVTGNLTVNGNIAQTGTSVSFNPANGLVVTGTFSGGAIPATGAGVRLMWYPNKGAFRAGQVNGTQWNDANVGFNSTALGLDTIASGEQSTAMGVTTTASGDTSMAMGLSTTASGPASTAMGNKTTASGPVSTAMGGNTTASGFNSTATGSNTIASGSSSTAMGRHTTASGPASTAMGYETVASGESSTAMGYETVASGEFSTAMGYYASTNGQTGSFVYGDNSSFTDVNATAQNQFVVRVQNIWLGRNNSVTATSGRFIETSTGAFLSSGGAWTNSSSRALKTNFFPVDSREVLRGVLRLPMTSWNYKAEDAGTRHLGPIAQDFYQTFKLGADDEHIGTVDSAGVALAAIQGLHQELTDRDQTMAAQQTQIRALIAQVEQQQIIMDRLRKLVCAQQTQADVCKEK